MCRPIFDMDILLRAQGVAAQWRDCRPSWPLLVTADAGQRGPDGRARCKGSSRCGTRNG